MFLEKARGQDVLVPVLVLGSGNRGRGAGDITPGRSQWLTDTNYDFNLSALAQFDSSPPHRWHFHLRHFDNLSQISRSLSLELLLTFLCVCFCVWVCASVCVFLFCTHTSWMQQLNILAPFIFCFNPCPPSLYLASLSRFLSMDLGTTLLWLVASSSHVLRLHVFSVSVRLFSGPVHVNGIS